MIKKLGLIAGNGELPIITSKSAKEKGASVIAVAIREETNPELEKYVDKIYWVNVGELKGLIDIFKKEGIKKAVMAGSVTKTRLFDNKPKLDSRVNKLLGSLMDKKDMALLKGVARILKFCGITLIDSTIFMKEYLPERGVLSRRNPTKEEWEDIKFGFSLAKRMSGIDIGQAVVIKGKTVLAVEAIEGTDEAILRGGKLGNGDMVVVKVARPKQDKRFDIPTVGPQTLKSLKEAGGRVLAIEARKMFLIRKDECVTLADANNLTLVAV